MFHFPKFLWAGVVSNLGDTHRRRRLEKQITESLAQSNVAPPQEGRVIIRHGATLMVVDESGQLFNCRTRQNIGHPVCGDRVVWQAI
ncbi:hypothetical protein QQ73_09370, partial [Candidatus Endoriftia persephone str. Guaymas]|nr:hypothetical protein [Candidatus Endoriftia persephone str. Guaymas]